MAQLEPIQAQVHIDLSEVVVARRLVKHLIRDAEEANRALAALQARLLGFSEDLSRYGITLEVER